MSNLQIRVDGQPLDLAPKEDDRFYITKQVHDIIKGLESREADFTRNISLPATQKNQELLRADRPLNSNQYPNQVLNCEIILEGIPVLNDCLILVTAQTLNTIETRIFAGTASFFNLLRTESIKAIDLTAYSFIFGAINGYPANRNNTSGVVTADTCFYNIESYEKAIDKGANAEEMYLTTMELFTGGFWFYIRTLIEEIFSQTMPQLQLDLQGFTPEMDKLALCCPVKDRFENLTKPPGYKATGTDPTDPIDIQPTQTRRIKPTVFSDPGGLWDGNNWIVPSPGLCTVYLNNTGVVYDAPAGQTGGTELQLVINGQVQERLILNDQVNSSIGFVSYNETIRYSFQAQVGDAVGFNIKAGASTSLYKVTVGLLNFSVTKEGNDLPAVIDNPADYLPDITQEKLIINVLKWFNLVPVQKDRVVTFLPFDSIIDTPPINKEIDRFDFGTITYLPTFGQKNLVKYADNDLLRRQDIDGLFNMEHEALPQEATAIQLDFSACDVGDLVGADVPDKVQIPQFSYEYFSVINNKMDLNIAGGYITNTANDLKVGDMVRIGGKRRQVIVVTNNKEGVFSEGDNLNQQDWQYLTFTNNKQDNIYIASMETITGKQYRSSFRFIRYSFTGDFKAAKFTPGLHFSNILNNYFARLTNMLAQPLVIQAWFNFTVAEFLALDNTQPIYIPSLGLSFYINKIEQFKRLGSVRVELIRI